MNDSTCRYSEIDTNGLTCFSRHEIKSIKVLQQIYLSFENLIVLNLRLLVNKITD